MAIGRTLLDTAKCPRLAVKHGFVGTVCTPHMAVRDFPAGPAELHDRLAGLAAVERLAGNAMLRTMLGNAPQEILTTG